VNIVYLLLPLANFSTAELSDQNLSRVLPYLPIPTKYFHKPNYSHKHQAPIIISTLQATQISADYVFDV
jgi:hypothetical protein